jgi:hypothetical protein
VTEAKETAIRVAEETRRCHVEIDKVLFGIGHRSLMTPSIYPIKIASLQGKDNQLFRATHGDSSGQVIKTLRASNLGNLTSVLGGPFVFEGLAALRSAFAWDSLEESDHILIDIGDQSSGIVWLRKGEIVNAVGCMASVSQMVRNIAFESGISESSARSLLRYVDLHQNTMAADGDPLFESVKMHARTLISSLMQELIERELIDEHAAITLVGGSSRVVGIIDALSWMSRPGVFLRPITGIDNYPYSDKAGGVEWFVAAGLAILACDLVDRTQSTGLNSSDLRSAGHGVSTTRQ